MLCADWYYLSVKYISTCIEDYAGKQPTDVSSLTYRTASTRAFRSRPEPFGLDVSCVDVYSANT